MTKFNVGDTVRVVDEFPNNIYTIKEIVTKFDTTQNRVLTLYTILNEPIWRDDELELVIDDYEYPKEFEQAIREVLEFGIKGKGYAPDGWLKGDRFDSKRNHESMFRHLAKDTAGQTEDDESHLDHLAHLACRALMEYTLRKRGLG